MEKLFKRIEVCECDICGKLAKPDILYGEDMTCGYMEKSFLPSGWTNLGNTGMMICNVCNKAFTELQDKYNKEKENV